MTLAEKWSGELKILKDNEKFHEGERPEIMAGYRPLAEVDDDGRCNVYSGDLSPEQAVMFAHWIIKNFSENGASDGEGDNDNRE